MFPLPLPLIAPRDSHELWYTSSQPYRSSSHTPTRLLGDSTHASPLPLPPPHQPTRRNINARTLLSATTPTNSLSALQLEERALRLRKQNIASFGYAWIRPAGCGKTMLGMKEEEAEREEALAAAQAAEMELAAAAGDGEGGDMDPRMEDAEGVDEFGRPLRGHGGGAAAAQEDDPLMERDLDDDIPDADDGLIEEGEEDLEDDDDDDNEGILDEEEEYLERDLDDDIPEADDYGDDDDDDEEDDDEENDFENQPNLDDNIPDAEASRDINMPAAMIMTRDLDDDIPDAEAGANEEEEEEEWQHTDSDAEFDDDDDHDSEEDDSFTRDPYTEEFRTSTGSNGSGLPPPVHRPSRETEAQRRFLQRWSGGADAFTFDTSGMAVDGEDDDVREEEGNLRTSLASNTSGPTTTNLFSRGHSRRQRRGGPRDSFM